MRRFLLLDELAGSVAGDVAEPVVAKTLHRVVKHLPGQHDQSTHGRGGSKKPSAQIRSGPDVPTELQGAFDYAVGRSREFVSDDEEAKALEFLQARAYAYAVSHGYSPNEFPYGEQSEAGLYANGLLRHAMNVKDQEERWRERGPEQVQRVHEAFDDWRAGGQVMVKVPSEHLDDILADRVKTQFDTDESGGLYDPDLRAIAELAAHGTPPAASGMDRPVYGFVSREGFENPVSVSQYGDVTLVLKDGVRGRTTVTLGDSLNTNATPVPLNGPVTGRQVSDASAHTFFTDEFSMVASRGTTPLAVGATYMEAQIHGGVRRSDIARIIFTGVSADLDAVAALSQELTGSGIEVDVYVE